MPSPNASDNQAQGATEDIDALFAALAEEERTIVTRYATEQRSIEERRQQARQALFDRLMPSIVQSIETLLAHGFPVAVIAKPVTPLLRSGMSAVRRRPTPTTHQAWYNIFLSREIQAYLRKNRELAMRVEDEGITGSDIAKYIPPSDLSSIQTAARVAAEKKIATSLPVQA